MLGLRARQAAFVVSAALVMPIAAKLGASSAGFDSPIDLGPRRLPMLLHILAGNSVGYTLETEGREQPVEKRRRATKGDGLMQSSLASFCIDVIEKRHRP